MPPASPQSPLPPPLRYTEHRSAADKARWATERPRQEQLLDGARLLGGDPGATTGLVCVWIAPSLEWRDARWLGSTTVTAPAAPRCTHAEADCIAYRKFCDALAPFAPTQAALEEPLDGQAHWTAVGAGARRETAFRLGAYYMALVAAVDAAGVDYLVSYPVHTLKGRRGWMPKATRKGEGAQRANALMSATQIARVLRAPVERLSEHELMALGIVMHRVGEAQAARIAARLAHVRAGAPYRKPAGA